MALSTYEYAVRKNQETRDSNLPSLGKVLVGSWWLWNISEFQCVFTSAGAVHTLLNILRGLAAILSCWRHYIAI